MCRPASEIACVVVLGSAWLGLGVDSRLFVSREFGHPNLCVSGVYHPIIMLCERSDVPRQIGRR